MKICIVPLFMKGNLTKHAKTLKFFWGYINIAMEKCVDFQWSDIICLEK